MREGWTRAFVGSLTVCAILSLNDLFVPLEFCSVGGIARMWPGDCALLLAVSTFPVRHRVAMKARKVTITQYWISRCMRALLNQLDMWGPGSLRAVIVDPILSTALRCPSMVYLIHRFCGAWLFICSGICSLFTNTTPTSTCFAIVWRHHKSDLL